MAVRSRSPMAPRACAPGPNVLRLAAVVAALPAAAGQVRVLAPEWLAEKLPRVDGSTAMFGAPFYGDLVLGRLAHGESRMGHSHCTEDDYAMPDEFGGGSQQEGAANSPHGFEQHMCQLCSVEAGATGKTLRFYTPREECERLCEADADCTAYDFDETRTLCRTFESCPTSAWYGGRGCGWTVFMKQMVPKQVRMINVLLVRRGKCSIVTKVKVAYKKGAHAVIVVDEEDSKSPADIREEIVKDDGFGEGIHIPTVLVSKEEGEKLLEAVAVEDVVVELSWTVPTSRVVELDLWMSSGSQRSLQFLKEFSPKRRALNEIMRFTPHYFVTSMPAPNPAVYNDLCVDDTGELCAEDPDAGGLVTGRDVLEEDVRQLCIHELSKVPTAEKLPGEPQAKFAELFWDYMDRFADRCTFEAANVNERFGSECSAALMQEIGIDVDRVLSCAVDTRTEKLRHERDHAAWSPRALRINGWRYDGMLDADLVTRAVCSGFSERPPECDSLLTPRDPFGVFPGASDGDQVSLSSFVLGLLCVAAMLPVGFVLYRRRLRKQLQDSVRDEVRLEVHSKMAAYSRVSSQMP